MKARWLHAYGVPAICRRHSKSGLSPYFLIPSCPSDADISVRASTPIYIVAIRGFHSKTHTETDMIRINQLKLPVTHSQEDLERKIEKTLRLPKEKIKSWRLVRQSVDARKKEELRYIYAVDVETEKESQVVKRAKDQNVQLYAETPYRFPKPGTEPLSCRPVIVGEGPAGLFCGLMLARAGYRPLLLERGEAVEERTKRVEAFWAGGPLDPNSNVQFGEGGAGTFSDGKLNTLVKDRTGRNRLVLETLAAFGADPAITYQAKPHIGTDVLSGVVRAIREEILRLGGEVRFSSQVTDLELKDGAVSAVILKSGECIPAQAVVLAVGHSARDTFQSLLARGIPMEPKPFAVGLRIQHPQALIDLSQYGPEGAKHLGAASYKLTHQASGGRGVYSFCMCPGGYVVNASSEEGRLAVNGMSNHDRGGKNANSALIVTVTPEDFGGNGPLAGVEFQRRLEERAYEAGKGAIPIQLYEDFKEHRPSKALGEVTPEMKGGWAFADLRTVLPEVLSQALMEGIEAFGGKIRGFDRPDAILAGVESRTSSPVRIPRDENLESAVRGLFPCGEGAGYAGGITSAAMDGVRVAEELVRRYAPPPTERHDSRNYTKEEPTQP